MNTTLSRLARFTSAFGTLCLLSVCTAQANDLPPTAVIDIDPERPNYLVYDGEVVFFSASGSHDNDEGGSAITFYEWYVNGSLKSSGSAAVSYSYAFQKELATSVKLRVKDDEGNWDDETMTVTVTSEPNRYYYLKDHLGSIRVTFNDNGDVVHGACPA